MGKVIGCGFCPQIANITGEHLWADWFGRELGIKDFMISRREPDGGSKYWRKKELNEKTNVVCKTCNNGWMSDLENAAKAVISDMVFRCSPTVLQPRDLEVIAAHTLKSAIVADLTHDNRPPYFSLFERRRFAQGLTIPEGVQMWFGSLAKPRGLFKGYYFRTKPGVSGGFELNVFTYGLGYLVVQVVASRWRKKAHRRHADSPTLKQNPVWDPVSIPFWPRDGKPISWPPTAHLSDEDGDKLVFRWDELSWA